MKGVEEDFKSGGRACSWGVHVGDVVRDMAR